MVYKSTISIDSSCSPDFAHSIKHLYMYIHHTLTSKQKEKREKENCSAGRRGKR
jgi:hypothetical protein